MFTISCYRNSVFTIDRLWNGCAELLSMRLDTRTFGAQLKADQTR